MTMNVFNNSGRAHAHHHHHHYPSSNPAPSPWLQPQACRAFIPRPRLASRFPSLESRPSPSKTTDQAAFGGAFAPLSSGERARRGALALSATRRDAGATLSPDDFVEAVKFYE